MARRRYAVTLALVMSVISLAVLAQGPLPAKLWLGTWKLDLQGSRLDERMLQIEGQVLRIEVAENVLVITGDTTLPGGRNVLEVARVAMTGETTLGPADAKISFRRVDDQRFEIRVQSRSPSGGEVVGTNRFEFSTSGRMLTETKTQTFSVEPAGTTSKATPVSSVLVFERQSP